METMGASEQTRVPDGMTLIEGGTAVIGCESFYPEEGPVREIAVDSFLIDKRPVTVGEFAAFVRETGYETVAEIAPTQDEYPDADPRLLVPARWCSSPPRGRSPTS